MQESYNLLQLQTKVLDLVSDAVIAINNQQRVIYLNQAATAQYGVEREEVIGQPLESLWQYRWINPEDEQAAYQALASTGAWKGENIHIKRNAEEIWVESTLSVLKDEQNNQIGLLAVIRDITERKQAQQEALRLSEEKFFKAFRCSPDAIVISTLSEGRILEVNDSFLHLFSCSREEVIGHTSTELNIIRPEDRSRHLQLLQRQGSIRNLEINIYSKSGEVHAVLLSVEPIEIGGEACILSILHDITDRVSAEEALCQSEEKFRQLAENIRDVFWIFDAVAQQFLYLSPAYERVWGRTCESVYTESWSFMEGVHPEDQESLSATIANLMLGETADIEYRVVHPNKEVYWLHARAFPIRNQSGEVYRIVGIAEDITDQKQAQQERDRFFKLSLDMLLIADFEGYFRQVNPAWEKTLGFTCEELQGQHYTELVHPEDLEETRTAVENQEVGIPTIAFENRYRCKDGSYKWLSWTGVPFAEEGLIYAVAHDVSDRVSAKEALRQSEEKFRQLAENSRDAFWMYDAIEEQHLYISPAYERIWGQTRENLYANPYLFLETIHPEDQERVRVAIETTRQGENQDIEYRIVRPNGEVRWICDRGFPIRNPSGQIYRFAGIAEDITDRKQAEEQQQKFVALIENSSDFIGMATLEGIPFFLNEAGRRLVGLDSLEEVRSTDIFVYHTPESEARFRDIARPTCMATGHWEGEGVFRHFKTGKPIDVYINVFLVRNPQNGEPLCMATVTRDITERKQAEEKIKASLREKEILLQEIYHRVKNNLQIVSSLLDLQSQRIQEPHILEIFQSSQNRIRSMALLHENLYKSENLANVNFADYIYSLTTHLFQAYAMNPDNITLQIHVDEVSLNIDTALPCGLIINELVSNALKHGFPGNTKGTIWISFSFETNQFSLIIGNDGRKLQNPIDFKTTQSLGLKLVDALVKQINGKIEIDSTQGLVFKIIFPT